MEILESGVSSLPFVDEFFDVVTVFETLYYWSEFIENIKEIYRVLVPYGKFLIFGGEYKSSRFYKQNLKWTKENGISLNTLPEFKKILEKEGFKEIKIFNELGKEWFCLFARKPLS